MKSIRYFIVGLFIIPFFLTACDSNKEEPEAKTKDKVKVQLAWIHEYSSVGFYTAEKKGYYDRENLEVEFTAGGFTDAGYIEPVDEVVNGTYDFGLTSAEALIRARSEGKPVVAIATIMQRSPNAIISLAEQNIQQPEDLEGHTILVADGGARNLYDALLTEQGIAPDTVNTLPRTSFGVDPLLNGEADAIVGWIINEGVELQENGQDASFILLSDYGIDTYNLIIFATDETIQKKPDMVEKFLRATFDGHKAVIDDRAETVTYILDYNDTLDKAAQERRLEAMIPLINIPGQNLGAMELEVWEYTQSVMLEAGMLETGIDLQGVYTTAFLDKIYSE